MDEPRICILLGAESTAAVDGLYRIPVALVTKGFKGKQKFQVTASDLAQMVENFRRRGTGDLVIDYDHSSLSAGDGEPRPAAGWLKKIDDAPDASGVLWGWAEYTKRAASMVVAQEYKYTSPVIEWGRRDKESGEQQGTTLTSIALTNSPLFERLPELPRIAASEAGWEFDRGEETAVEVAETRKEKRVVKQAVLIASAAGFAVRLVADDNTETTQALEGLRVISMSDVKRGADGRFDFTSVPQEAGVLVASDVLRGMEAQTELDAAIAKGVILPAQRGFYESAAVRDLAGFRQLVASMKPAVDLVEHGIGGGDSGEVTEIARVEALLDSKVKEKLAGNDKLQYHEALKLVASENPELDRKRTQLIRERS